MSVTNSEATPARVAARNAWRESSSRMYRPARNEKLTPTQRSEIALRYSQGEHPKVLAAEYGISRSYIYNLGSR